jgi:Ca2+-binding RTX toxin-like protein
MFGLFNGKAHSEPVVFAQPVESLEDRTLFASFTFSGGVLTASGTSAAERFTVYRVTGPSADEIHVRVRNLSTGVEQDSGAKTTSTVTRVECYGSTGDDEMVVEDATDIANGWTPLGTSVLGTAFVNKPTKLSGDGGSDTLYGGSPGTTVGDTLIGGTQDDWLYGRGGNDSLYGGYGQINDTASDNGNDYLDGGDDSDVCYGGYGNDTLTGGNGTDYVNGEHGDDQFWSNNDGVRDNLDGGPGTDRAFGEWDGGNVDILTNIENPF